MLWSLFDMLLGICSKHHINYNIDNADLIGRTTDAADVGPESAKPCLSDIQLDRTPTDAEIDVLWDKVRDCLLDSPANSVRSAPPDIQQTPSSNSNNNSSGLPPKQPIKKVSDITLLP